MCSKLQGIPLLSITCTLNFHYYSKSYYDSILTFIAYLGPQEQYILVGYAK